MEYSIQKLRPEEYQKCNAIWDMGKNPENAKRWYDELTTGNRIIFVYVENGEYLAEGALVLQNGDPDYTIPNQRIYLSRLIVRPECRHLGIGSRMVDYLINYAKKQGYSEMTVGVDITNINARWLYEKKGFTNIIFVGEDEDGRYVKLLKPL